MADSKVSHSSKLFSSHLSIDQLVDVIDLLKRSGYPETRWQDLGLRLGLHKNTLDAIERNHPGDVTRCLTECLSKWLRKADNVNSKGGATFDSLSNALRSMDETAVADKLDEERCNAMATCIFDTHCHNLSQSLCDPVSVAWMLYGERVLVKQAVTSVESGSPFIPKQREALLDALKEVIQLNYKNLQTLAIVLCKFPRNMPLGEAMHTDYEKCFPSSDEFIKVKVEEGGSSTGTASSTDSVLSTSTVEIPIRKSMSQDFSSIRASYGRMMYNVRKAIRSHQVDFDELIDFTISCSSDIEEKLDKSSDVASVLRVIEKKECSLIDTSLISAVVEEFRVTEAERYVEEYREKLREFCRSISVTLCLKEKFEANPSLQCETATYVFDWRPDEKKLKDITDILSKTSGRFVKIKFIDTGYSIVITCSFPHSLIGALITKLIENLDVLIKNCLKKFTIGCCLIWKKQKLEKMEQLLEEGIDVIKANQGNMNQDPYYLQKKKKQLTACHLEDSGMQSLDTSFAIATSQVKKEREANKRLEEKLQKLKEKHRIQHMLMLTNTGSALSRIRRGMRMEIEELILYLTANKSDLEDQNAAIVENKREIEYLQEQISSTSVQLLMKRKENEAMKADIKKEKQILSNQVKLLYEKDEVKEKDPKVAVPEKMEESTEKKVRNDFYYPTLFLHFIIQILPTDTLLFDQPWFHAELTRNDAEMLLDDYKDIPGAFLVREPASSTNYAISFIFQQVCNHMMIQQKFKEGKMKYYLFRYHLKFDSIFELIEYYHQYPIIMGQTQNTFVMLTVAVPKINDYEARPWFSNVSKIEAEDMLNSVLLDGAFLVRPSSQESEDGKKALAISLRGNDKICHIRITKDGEQFTIGGPAGFTFGNLIELIYYYKYQPIYLNTKLTHPINKEILEQKTSSALMQSPHLHVYESIKEHPITVHALYDFKARRADELSFECGAVITNVEKIHEDWWRGEYKGSRGVFPASYVKEIL
uniref:Uncharacterized protein n=1 Tax=Amphimedon queenslandica TaxID=400682 RepID=A0A1X7UDL4_AMPQE